MAQKESRRRTPDGRSHRHPRLACMLLLVAMFSPSAAIVDAEQDKAPAPLRAGAATSNITPFLGVSMNGGMRDRQASHVHDELHARSIVLDNGHTRLAFVICDSCMIPESVFNSAKAMAHEHTGIPVTHVLMAATHTHSAPTSGAVFQSEPVADYQQFLSHRIADAVRCAVNQLEPARIGWGVGNKPEHVFNRRWRMKEGTIAPDPFGRTTDLVKMNPPRGSADLIEPAGPTDPDVPVLSVQSADGRPVAVLANYALHYVGGGPGNHISADYFGMFADRIQQLMNADRLEPPFVGVLTNGASGDINNINFREQPPAQQPYEQMRIVANDVAAEAFGLIQGMPHQEHVVLGARQTRLELGVRKPAAGEVERARQILADMKTDDARTLDEIYALETIAMSDYPETAEVLLQVLRIGEVGIVAIPCEVFVEVGLELKRKSPFRPTIVIELANGYHGYLPTPGQHELGGYETWRARSSHLEVNAAPRIVDALLDMLNELKQSDAG